MNSVNPTSDLLVTIGVDPHPGSHTAAALDPHGRTLDHQTISNDDHGTMQLLAWARQFKPRCWAIEGAGNHFATNFVTALQMNNEIIINIPPAFTSQYRSRRGRKKNDLIDAENIARAALANPGLPSYMLGPEQRKLQELSRTHQRLAKELKANRMARKELSSPEVERVLTRVAVALENAVKALKHEMTALVENVAPLLLSLLGVGPVIAATLLAEVGDVARFRTRDRFVIYAGCAPITRASGAYQVMRVNPGGNRRVNWALHMLALVRLRFDERSRVFMEKKLAEGKTRREALRCLKTHVAREIYRVLRASQVGDYSARAVGPCS